MKPLASYQWVRVVGGKENAASLVKAAAEVLAEHGWECETAEADAADWDSNDE